MAVGKRRLLPRASMLFLVIALEILEGQRQNRRRTRHAVPWTTPDRDPASYRLEVGTSWLAGLAGLAAA